MNFKNILAIGLFLLMVCSTAAQEHNFRERQAGHVYHVSIPDYMGKTYNLNDAASLQYLNAAKETYVIVIEDSKEQLVQAGSPFKDPAEFYKFFEQQFTDNSCTISPLKTLKINGNPAVQTEINKPFEEYNISYLVTVIETETHFYKMLAWTLAEFKDQYFPDFKQIASSLRE